MHDVAGGRAGGSGKAHTARHRSRSVGGRRPVALAAVAFAVVAPLVASVPPAAAAIQTTSMPLSALRTALVRTASFPAPVQVNGAQGAVLPGSGPNHTTVGGSTVSATVAKPAVIRPVQAHYAAPVRGSDGTIDAIATLQRVKARGSQTYSYLLYPKAGYNSARDWAALPGFLAVARDLGMRVTVTLTPPSSTSTTAHPCTADMLLPYQGRYDTWMRELGALARVNPNLTAVAMDDFGYSSSARLRPICRTFTPGTLTRWNTLLSQAAGRPMRVLPVLYLYDLTHRWGCYGAIAKEAPEVIWPFATIGNAAAMRDQYRAILKASPKIKVNVMIYAAPYRGLVPTAKTVRDEYNWAVRLQIPGVIFYQQPLTT